MKKIIFLFISFLSFISITNAQELFHLGDKVPDIVIYMDRINKQVYYQPKKIYRNLTNELVYCIQPGIVLSNGEYESFEDYNTVFNITEEQFNRIKLIAYYGYNYDNHTDIKWYAITQYLIWLEIKPDNWTMYFSNSNHERLDNLFQDEINEIYDLVKNHDSSLGLKAAYILNNRKEITIKVDNMISNYEVNNGKIDNNNLVIENLKYGNNEIKLTYKNYNPVLFYYNEEGQNVFKRGDTFNKVISTSIYVKGGKVNINECNEETFEHDFIGGTYEVLNEDDAILYEIKCESSKCLTDYLPVGFHKIRVKNLPSTYESNEHIYDVEVKDGETSDVTICSFPKKIVTKKIIEKEEEANKNDEKPYEYDDIEVIDEELKIVDVPNTYKYSFIKIILILATATLGVFYIKNDKNTI
jgi:hypothetical protein